MTDDQATEVPFRILPALDDRNRAFWTSGGEGALKILRCQNCGYYIHPPTPICPECLSDDLVPEAVSGRATVATYSVNYQQWMPGPEVPFVAAIVELEEQPSVRLRTNIVGCAPEAVHIDQAVHVVFEHHPDPDGDIYIPLFTPDDTGARP
ncbi:MAG: Zn-ribbon domain-containing OB-fold protein [Acidimicrobiales bacterium]